MGRYNILKDIKSIGFKNTHIESNLALFNKGEWKLILEKDEEKPTYCCEDFRLSIEEYRNITQKGNITRFLGSVISYCPFCGKKIE